MKNINYDEIMRNAKKNTVYNHCVVWAKAIVLDEKMTDREKFVELHRLIIEATNNLEEE